VSGYTLPDGLTLKNKLGATNQSELEDHETEPVRQRLFEIEMGYGPTGHLDASHLKAIHHYVFQDVYEWAGHTRDERVALSDGSVATEPHLKKPDGQPFLIGPAIPAALDQLGAKLSRADYLRGLSREEFAERAADLIAELNAVHPFREGNGRTQRVFMEQLARSAGHDLDFTVVSKERMTQASIAANEQGDPSMMRRMFDEISHPPRAALLRESVAGLEKLNFKWNDHYIATLAPGHPVELVFAGAAGEQFMGRTRTEILFGRIADLPEPRPAQGESFGVTATAYARYPERRSGAKDNPESEVSPSVRGYVNDRLAKSERDASKRDAGSNKEADSTKGRGRDRGGRDR
jgi:cell filamentation protein